MMSIMTAARPVLTALRSATSPRPTVWARAPGRVDLMGSHTDYNLGLRAHAAHRPRHLDRRPASRGPHGAALFANLTTRPRSSSTTSSPRRHGTGATIRAGWPGCWLTSGITLVGFDGVLHGTVPIGSGLSSSAAWSA